MWMDSNQKPDGQSSTFSWTEVRTDYKEGKAYQVEVKLTGQNGGLLF